MHLMFIRLARSLAELKQKEENLTEATQVR